MTLLAPLSLAASLLLTQAPPPPPPAPAAEAPKRTFSREDGRLVVPDGLTFETGSAKLQPQSEEALAHVAAYLKEKEYVSTMRIEGHAAEQKLSEQRALAVGKRLVALGVDCKRLLAVGFGPNKPVADASTAEGRSKNIRIEFRDAGLRGHAMGGLPLDGGGNPAGDLCAK